MAASPDEQHPMTSPTHPCESCRQSPDRLCLSCAARRRAAGRLFADGRLSIAQIAARMRLSEPKVIRLLEELADREALRSQRRDLLDNALVREMFDAWQARDPQRNSYLELARLAGYGSSGRVQRLLGLIPTSTIVKRDGSVYPGQIRTTISCENAARLVRAMGYLPCEIPWL
jgi:hypothetical protein